jgi:hypothetical protein
MKRSPWIRIAVNVVLISATASATVNPYRAVLNGEQLVPPATVVATGEAAFQFDDEKRALTGTITYRGLSGAPLTANLHQGACGANGALTISLGSAGPTETVVDAILSEERGNDLGAGNLYIVISTDAHTEGEIRGQLYYPRPPQYCPLAGADAGSDAGFTPREGFPNSAPSSTGPAPFGPWTGASSAPADTDLSIHAPTAGSGCSTIGSTRGSHRAIAYASGLSMTAIARRRRKRAHGAELARSAH